MKVGVFLSAKSNLPDSYRQAATEVGALLGDEGHTLVYGGADRGLMEVLAQSVKAHGGRVYGIVPDILEKRGWVSDAIDVTFRCADLTDRKMMMNRESDVLVALPGGIGTLDEVFTVLANTGIGIKRQPVIFFNVDDCWQPLLSALDALFAQGLISGQPADYYSVVRNVDELRSELQKLQ